MYQGQAIGATSVMWRPDGSHSYSGRVQGGVEVMAEGK